MEGDLIVVHDVIEDEKVNDSVYKHFREVTDGSLFNHGEVSFIKERGSSTRRDNQTLSKGHCKNRQGAVLSGKILSFGCLVCKDGLAYSPNDLLKHFQVAHAGTLPTYPCDLCGFVTNEFAVLQRHRIEHRNTLVTCELCNDGVQYSLLLVTRHYMMCHSQNGLFNCDWCDFTTTDAGTFVQHIHHHNESHWKCSECRHISLCEDDHQEHMNGHSGLFPFTCLTCGYGAMRSEDLKKHFATVHKYESEKQTTLKTSDDDNTWASAALKLWLKKTGQSQETQRTPKLNCLSSGLSKQFGRPIRPKPSFEETQHVDGTVAKKDNNWEKSSHSTDQSVPVMLHDVDNSAGSDFANHKSPNGLTVLKLKNKLSLPPNCTTKVIGFKMVDGKKHLVLKVIQSPKQDSNVQNNASVEDTAPSPVLNKNRDFILNGNCLDGKSSTSHSLAELQQNGSCSQMEQEDVMAVKIKIEEEETFVCNPNSTIHSGNTGPQASNLQNMSSTGSDSMTYVNVKQQSPPSQTTTRSTIDKKSVCQVTDLSISTVSEGTPGNRSTADSPVTEEDAERHQIYSAFYNDHQFYHSSVEKSNALRLEIKQNNGHQNIPSKTSPAVSPGSDTSNEVFPENCTQITASQEVFTFHNYSKETFSSLLNTNHDLINMAGNESANEPSQFNLKLAASPKPFTESSVGETARESHDGMEVTDGNNEQNEYTASGDVALSEDESLDSVLQDFNIIKVEEDCIPISPKPPETKSSSTSFGSVVEQHSDAIISQQLEKERIKDFSTDSSRQTKTTLRILQLPDGKQSVVLSTAGNRQANLEPGVKSTSGFKLLTNSSHPQINVSYMKPSGDRDRKTNQTLTTNSRTLAVSASAEKGTLHSAVQPGASTSHYILNSSGLKGPVLLSSTPQNTLKDKSAKSQSTCFLLQKSLPVGQTTTTPALRLASTKLPLSSRPVLAVPVSTADKSSTVQSGRQAFLLRYISPTKSGLILNNSNVKSGSLGSQNSDNASNKVIFKLVSPSGSLLTSGASTSNSQPLFLARPQTQCLLVASNRPNANASNGVKKIITVQNTLQNDVMESSPQMNVMVQSCEADKPMLAPRSIRPPSQRKRRRKALFDELPTVAHKSRRLSNRVETDKETEVLWRPVAKDFERTLRLAPFSSQQEIKYPRRHQPVVVLNHPDADIPEAANIMKAVHKHRGSVTKVSLSQKTVQALANLGALGANCSTKGVSSSSHSDNLTPRLVQSSVRERFLLKMMLRKKSRKKYEVVDAGCRQNSVVFECWFCGRLFDDQEEWIGHGQRHLMEATRDWNELF